MTEFYAAGALVPMGSGILLFQKKGQNGYDIPFGKREIGETPEQTAIREVLEETGYLIEIIPHAPCSRKGKNGVCITFLGKVVEKREPTHPHEGKAIIGDIKLLDTGKYPDYNRRMLQHFGFLGKER